MVAGGIISPGLQKKKCMWRKKTEANKEIRVYLKRSLSGSCSRVTPGTAHRTHPRPNQTEARMRTSLVMCCCVFALQCFPSTLCLPVRGSSRYKVAPVSWRTLVFFPPFHLLQNRSQTRENFPLEKVKTLMFWCRMSRFGLTLLHAWKLMN